MDWTLGEPEVPHLSSPGLQNGGQFEWLQGCDLSQTSLLALLKPTPGCLSPTRSSAQPCPDPIPRAWLCVCFQEPEVREFQRVQPSNRGSYLPVDTQDHAVSGRASSMPRLTVDPQVKPSKAPTGAGSKQSLPGNTGDKTF